MAFNFVVEVGLADHDANSYCTVEFADDYIEANPHVSDDWFQLEEEEKQRWLVRASKLLDIRFKWHGTRVDPDSGLKWPQAAVYDEDGHRIPDNVIPRILKEATAEFATYLMADDWSAPRGNDEFKKLQVDVINVQFNENYRRAYLPDTIVQMLAALGAPTSGNRPGFKKIVRH